VSVVGSGWRRERSLGGRAGRRRKLFSNYFIMEWELEQPLVTEIVERGSEFE
jgi:hypothetical protein